ncbi:hypothetical protein [Jeotgalibaca caeni]|uniref:hypothetical protein n=1 Tax=Jeotgalibaca caeni TaxID=3028623 RepID=UPI00237E4AB9|nr:hypothetical protein [Jeotgalibaca caeni]MDE1549660.1 hypothetical protein [Jeotgalibaca caeni]
MKKMTDLLTYELNRMKTGYVILMGLIVVLQTGAVFLVNHWYVRNFEIFQRETQGSILEFQEQFGPATYVDVVNNVFFNFAIFLGLILLCMYALGIWYRDWIGKNNLSYRLLTLPGSRMSIFFAKLLTILFMIAGLLALELVVIVLGDQLLSMIVPNELYQSTTLVQVINMHPVLFIVLPPTIVDFFVHYIVGISALVVLYMMILLELSYKWKGILIDFAIVAVSFLVVIVAVQSSVFKYLFPHEVLLIGVFLSILCAVLAGFISKKLLQSKITV